jgi:hypothetical protein
MGVWTDGIIFAFQEGATSAKMNLIADNFDFTMHTLARKSADQIVNNSTTLVNDTHLFWPVEINQVWFVQAWLMIDTGTTPDIKVGWTLPGGATMRWGFLSGDTVAGNVPQWGWNNVTTATLATTGTLAQAGSGAGVVNGLNFTGIAAIGGTAGNVQLQWAQNTLNASDTKVLLNSALIGCRLA